MVTDPGNPSTRRQGFGAILVKRLFAYTGIMILVFLAFIIVDYLFGITDLIYDSRAGYIPGALTTSLAMDILVLAFLFVWLVGCVLVVWRVWVRVQNEQVLTEDSLSKEDLRRAILSRNQRRFWVSFGLYSVIMIMIIGAFFMIKDSRIWYTYEPWYELLVSLKTLFPFVLALLWVGGAFVLLFMQWRQSASDIVGLVDSIEQMQTEKQNVTIAVPRDLQELQPTLQGIFNESLENRRVAEESEKRKNDLILYLAHDLKTPLTSVVGYLSLIEDSKDLTDLQKEEYARIARQKALRLEDLIEQFFEISRFNMHDFSLKKAYISLNILLTQIADEFYPLATEKKKTIELVAEDAITLYGDADMLARALNNILKNALAYSFDGSTIQINAAKRTGGVLITIVNEGNDIPEAQLNDVFEKFYRLDEARASNAGGAGLGLAIAKEIIERHGGTITAHSANGITTFSIDLPHVGEP